MYTSKAFTAAYEGKGIVQSMSRAGTLTDNPIIESLNGWLKAEMRSNFKYYNEDNLADFLELFVHYYNNKRPAYALNYRTPIQFKTEQGF